MQILGKNRQSAKAPVKCETNRNTTIFRESSSACKKDKRLVLKMGV